MPSLTPPPVYGFMKPRISIHKVCEILGVHEDTMRDYMRRGVLLPDGSRMPIYFIKKPRRTEFECEEVERIYQALRICSDTDAA